ncbi:hypothetical protein [Mesorhizobium sp.]|nr:hypothetical protein [Mesorhizobium sp.]RUV26064.1 hypothetical protein EOA86_25225 [Mesorhizobium sp. M5C.F.Ca.IN.020.32.2.1]RUV96140.1 hypothetical protein EOA88_03100 [Mesorhizobium sp. M5C.F.Ca.IN.020.14.1.1]RWG45314.1 MAG: hypothetical protein EOQ62_18030 [Mesorhizobium sp.]RWH49140.1 MAG: hypothetical protein EOQ80_08220 [Mesorhizobium sp.]RWH55620.1 MAG: hypothetical protein EOQ82_14585 [Mesorhizobium sp.]
MVVSQGWWRAGMAITSVLRRRLGLRYSHHRFVIVLAFTHKGQGSVTSARFELATVARNKNAARGDRTALK